MCWGEDRGGGGVDLWEVTHGTFCHPMLSSVEGERGYTVLSSPSSVLLCNLTLQAGESKTGE